MFEETGIYVMEDTVPANIWQCSHFKLKLQYVVHLSALRGGFNNYLHVYLCSLVRHAPYEGPLPDSQESPTETEVQKMVSYQSLC